MKKRYKALFWIGGIVVIVGIIITFVVLYANSAVTAIADRELRKYATTMQGKTLDYKGIDIRLLGGTIDFDSVRFTSYQKDTISLCVSHIHLGGFRLLHAIRRKHLNFKDINIQDPVLYANILKSHHAKQDTVQQDTLPKRDIRQLLEPYLQKVSIEHLNLDNGSLQYLRADNHLSLSLDSLSVGFSDLAYSLSDSIFTYNDSVYSLQLSNLYFLSSDGLFKTDLRHFSTANSGAILLKDVHARHTPDKWHLATRKGKVPVTWFNARFDEVRISPTNILRQLTEGAVRLDTISLTGNSAMFRDTRYPPREPYLMPQAGIMSIPIPVKVSAVIANLKTMAVEVATANDRCGILNMNKVKVAVSNFSNTTNATTHINARGGLGAQAKMQVGINLQNDKKQHFTADMHVLSGSGESLDPFLVPIAGVSIRVNLTDLECKMSGDKAKVTGDFCMIYDSLRVTIDKDKMPQQAMARNAGIINFFLSMLVPPNNPRHKGKEPEHYTVSAERNPQKNFAVYIFSPVIDGIKQTIFPVWLQQKIDKKQNQ